MVKLDKIYTRGGDAGETSLGDGRRVAKHDLRVVAYGTVDEANAVIGMARLHTTGEDDKVLERIQNDLFDLGADLCTPHDGRHAKGALRISEEQVRRLEAEIDAMNADIAPLTSFILPGRGPSAPGPHGDPARRTHDDGPRRGRGGQPGSGEIRQPPVGPLLRHGPAHERQRQGRRALDSGRQPLSRSAPPLQPEIRLPHMRRMVPSRSIT